MKRKAKFLLILILMANWMLTGLPLASITKTEPKVAKADSNPHVGFFSPERQWTAATDADLNLTYPDPRNGDLLVAMIAIRPSASTVNTPTGWTAAGSWSGDDGNAEGADTGTVTLYWFYKVADGTEGTGTQTFTETGTTSVWIGSIMQARSSTGTYSVSTGGYSKNGDTTNWNGTLDTDIGVTAGDIMLIGAAQNGAVGAYNTWGFTATGVTSFGTVNEHAETQSNSGNRVRVGVAETFAITGTNTATPAVTLSLGGAASGAVAAMRIRQGAGTNRTDTWVRSAGAQNSGTGDLINVPYPEHEVGDMLVMYVENKHYTATPTTPTNWNDLGTYYGGDTGSTGNDLGTARITAYYREVTGSILTGSEAVTVTGDSVSIGQMIVVHRDDVTSWSVDSDGGSDNDATSNSWSVTGSGMNFATGDIVLVGTGWNTDSYNLSSQALSASGVTFADVTRASFYQTSAGDDTTLEVDSARVSAGSGTGVAPTYSATTSSFSSPNRPMGASLIVSVTGSSGSTTFTLANYRFYVDSDSEDVSDPWGNPNIAENTALTTLPATNDPPDSADEIRLRVAMTVNTLDLSSSSQQFKLQYKAGTDGSCTTGSWSDVGASGSGTIWRFATSSVTDGTTLTVSRVTSDVLEVYAKANPTATNPNSATTGQEIEYDFHIEDNGAASATQYSFRTVESDGTVLDAYTNCPTLTTRPGSSDVMRHGNFFSGEIEKGFIWAD